MYLDSINLWYIKTDNQNVALEGMYARYKQWNTDKFFETSQSINEKSKNADKEYETVYLDKAEYIREINITTASANGKIGVIEFITTYHGRKFTSYGVGISRIDEGPSEPQPPGETKNFNFLKGDGENFPGYVVGFYGQYDDNHITHLGVYIAPFTEINYYSRRPYILAYKKLQQNKNLVDDVAKRLKLEKEVERYKDATLEDRDSNSSQVLFYFLEASLTHPELFKAVLEYL